MCLVVFAHRVHSEFPFVLVGNRDEFYDRPTASARYWPGNRNIFGGRDLRAGGGWLAASRHGKIATITNFRDPPSLKSDAPSRGEIVEGFLKNQRPANQFFSELNESASRYNGFNLIARCRSELYYYTNRQGDIDPYQRLDHGIYGVSNHYLNTPWPKLQQAKAELERQIFANDSNLNIEALFEMMADQTLPPDDLIPHTGIELEWDRALSTAFIRTPEYGTRSTSIVLVDRHGNVHFSERVFQSCRDEYQTTHHKIITQTT